MPTIFETTDIDVAGEVLRRTYGRARLSAPGTQHRVRIAQAVIGATELHRIEFQMRLDATSEPMDSLVVGRVRAGVMVYRDSHRDDAYTTGDVYLMGHPPEEYDSTVDGIDAEFARLRPGLVNQIAEGSSGAPIRFTGYRPVNAAAARLWERTYAYARDNAAIAATEPLLADTVSRLLAATALATFPSTVLHDPTSQDRHDAHPAALRRAMAYIEACADREISLADVAAAARVTIRAVQLAFRRHLGTTPLAYLSRVRLAHAHRDLSAAAPDATTVAAIAARWGFVSHGRFTARYRATYECTPSQTLHRR